MAVPPRTPNRLRLSTRDVPRRDRIGLWREELGRSILRLDIEALPRSEFRIDVDGLVLPGLFCGTVRGEGTHERRTRELLTDGNDGIAIVINRRTPLLARARGKDMEIAPGQGAIFAWSEESSFVRPRLGEARGLNLARAALTPLVPDLDDRVARLLSPQTGALGYLASYLEVVDRLAPDASEALQNLVIAHVNDLVALVIGASRDAHVMARGRGLAAARLHAIKTDMLRRLGDASLSAASVSRRHRIGARQMQRLFEQDGTTFTAFLLDARLDRARVELLAADRKRRLITAVALDNGFGDLSYFCRAFKRRFGCSPSDLRDGSDRQ